VSEVGSNMKFLMTIASVAPAVRPPDDAVFWAPDEAGALELIPQAVSNRRRISPGSGIQLL